MIRVTFGGWTAVWSRRLWVIISKKAWVDINTVLYSKSGSRVENFQFFSPKDFFQSLKSSKELLNRWKYLFRKNVICPSIFFNVVRIVISSKKDENLKFSKNFCQIRIQLVEQRYRKCLGKSNFFKQIFLPV